MSPPFHVCRDGDPVPAALRGAIVAVGNFDGVHRGHRRLIEVARELGSAAGGPNAVLTFEPHPRIFFNPAMPLFRLTPGTVKIDVLRRQDLDGVFVRRFDAALAALTADAFVTSFLRDHLQVAGVVVGHDFHFGQGRTGTPGLLEELCARHGLACAVVPAVSHHGRLVSSSAIRAELERGDAEAANGLLGYRWFVRADVRHGDKRGRLLGYPTANLRLAEDCRLRHGIYAVRARVGDRVHRGVASYGRRPTFDNGAPLLEVHLFEFSGDLYGQDLDVEFVGWIRGEERFESVEALVARMDQDSLAARALLDSEQTPSLVDPAR